MANSATEGMLAGIPRDLRRRLKEQVYYSEEHFMEVGLFGASQKILPCLSREQRSLTLMD